MWCSGLGVAIKSVSPTGWFVDVYNEKPLLQWMTLGVFPFGLVFFSPWVEMVVYLRIQNGICGVNSWLVGGIVLVNDWLVD